MEIEVRPGIVSKTEDGKIQCMPIRSRILSLFAEHNELQYAVPGGLIGTLVLVYLCVCAGFFRKKETFVDLHVDTTHTHTHTHTGVGTKIDPTLCRADRLVGQVLGAVGALPDIYTELEISYFLLRRLLGVRTEGDKKGAKVC